MGREARVFRQWERQAHVVQLPFAKLQAHAGAFPFAVIKEHVARREQEQQRGVVGSWELIRGAVARGAWEGCKEVLNGRGKRKREAWACTKAP